MFKIPACDNDEGAGAIVIGMIIDSDDRVPTDVGNPWQIGAVKVYRS